MIVIISDLDISLKLSKKSRFPFKSNIAKPTVNPGSNPTMIGVLDLNFLVSVSFVCESSVCLFKLFRLSLYIY